MKFPDDYIIPEQSWGELYSEILLQDQSLLTFDTVGGAQIGEYLFTYIDADAKLGECCTEDLGESAVRQESTEVICIKVNEVFCDADLDKVIRPNDIKFGAGYETLGTIGTAFARAINRKKADVFSKLLWQGDKTGSSAPMNRLNGILKQYRDAGREFTGEGTSIYDVIENGLLSLGDAALSNGAYIYARPGIAAKLKLAMRKSCCLSEVAPVSINGSYPFMDWDNIIIIPTTGLEGFNGIVIIPRNDVKLMTNEERDLTSFRLAYSEWHDQYKYHAKWLAGIKVIHTNYGGVFTLTDDQIAAPISINVNATNTATNPVIVQQLAEALAIMAGTSAQVTNPVVSESTTPKTDNSKKTASTTPKTE